MFKPVSQNVLRGRVLRSTAIVGVLACLSGAGLWVQPASAASVSSGKPAATHAHAVTGTGTATPKKIAVKDGTKNNPYKASATALPSASSGSAALKAPVSGAAAGAKASVIGTPVWAQTVASKGTYAGPSGVRAAVGSQALATKLGISGVVLAVSGTGTGTGQVRVGLDYAAFAQAYGGNFGSRLQFYTLPACSLTTPQVAACRVRTPLASANDAAGKSVSAIVKLTGSGASASGASFASASFESASTTTTATVLAASAGTGQEGAATGNYAASTVSPNGSWTSGSSSGSFDYNYTVSAPGSSSSLTPKLTLSYDSGSVDGKTSMTNAQSSWVGDGWQTPDSYVEQSFIPCSDNPEGTASPTSTSDMCYDGNVLTISLNGTTTSLVRDDTTGDWKLANDNGATVTHKTGTSNGSGTYNTDYWVVTERDGTSYYFGRNELPGYASGDATTNSVDSEPVYSAHSGDPCYSSSGFTSSACTMAYRWHLDYVTDTHGEAMAYYYTQATNYYGKDSGASNVSYVRDSYLKEIDYGFTTTTGPFGTIPDKVLFTTGSRCAVSSCPTLSSSLSASTAASDYPDIPTDLLCASGATCTSYSPSFFSTVNLASITTEQYSVSAAAYKTIDGYALAQNFPATGDSSSGTLWLESITHTGDDTSAGGSTSSISEPSVSFSGTDLPNRLDTTTYPGLYRWRISAVTGEFGSVTSVTYGIPNACSTSTTTSSNTTSCYPVYWTPSGYTAPIEDWFIKYAVTKVQVADATGGATTKTTEYSYSSPAWHYDDNEVVKSKYRTYGQFRGYQSVTTLTGDGANDPQTESKTTYYQGMYGDYLSSSSTRTTTVTDSQGGVHTDYNALAGKTLETTAYLGNGGAVDHSSVSSYWVSSATATRARTGLPSLTANMTATAEAWTRQALTDGGTTTWRYTETDDTYDATTTDTNFGLPEYEYSHTVPVSTAYDKCTTTTYAPGNTSLNLIGLVASTETDSVACSGFTEGSTASVPAALNAIGAPTSVTRPDNVISASETFYDDTTFSTTFPQTSAPTVGNVTMTRKARTYASSAFTWQTTTRKTYDAYGRVEDSYDGNGNETVTAYTLDSANLTTGQSVTNAKSQATTETLDPTRGLVLTSTDPNGVVTTKQYDALGRVTSEWLDSRYTSTSTPAANYLYTYTESNSGLSGSEVEKMNDELGYTATITIEDSLGRTRQTQANTPDGGMLVTDTFYDTRGLVSRKYNAWWDSTTTPSMTLVTTQDSQIPSEDVYTYDGLGRTVEDASEKYANTVSTTYTVYSGDATTVIPPTGGATKTTKTDALGRTSAVLEYSVAPTLTVPSNTNTGLFYITGGTALTTSYGYDGHSEQSTTTDADGQTWTTVYDLLGEVTEKIDPTAGTSYTVYDADGNIVQTEDSRGDYLSYTYDALDRKTGEYASVDTTTAQTAGPSGTQIAAWYYDNSNGAVTSMANPIGHVTTKISYAGGNTYTTQYKGFNVFGESTGETITIPSAVTGLSGTYTVLHTYSTYTGLLQKDVDYTAGGLATESVSHTYTGLFDLPSGLGSTYGYAQTTSYDAYSRVSQEEIGSATYGEGWITDTYDVHTGKLTDKLVTRGTSTPANVDDTAYTYDLFGNITKQVETRLGSSSDTETQCYIYNALDELTTAWSATDACATTPTASSFAMVGNTLGTGSAYWTSWTYNSEGNRQTQDQHSLTASTNDKITTSTYATSQPNTLASTATTVNGTQTASTSYGYDTAGNTTTRTTAATGTQTMTWDAAGNLTKVVSTTAGTTSYVYDADGNLLVQTTPTATTVYLESEQITYTDASAAVSGIRYYPLPGGGTAVRTSTTTGYQFEITDQHNTADLYLDYTAQTPTWRQFDPYGNARGTTVAWIDNRTFLNKVTDTSTGLTDVGARWYDPTLGRFASLDSVLETTDNLALGGYSYTDGNPVTSSDPSGHMLEMDGGDSGSSGNGSGGCGSPGFIGPCVVTTSSSSGSSSSGGSSKGTASSSGGSSDSWSSAYSWSNTVGYSCGSGSLCTNLNVGDIVGGFGTSVSPLAKNLPGLRIQNSLYQGAMSGQGIFQNTDNSEYINKILSTTLKNSSTLTKAGKVGSIAGYGLSGAGGVVSGIGEYQSTHDVGRAVAVGVTDTGINVAAGMGGTAVGGAVTDMILGTEFGASLGPAGMVVGAVAGAVVGAALAYGVDNLANETINAVSNLFGW